jgi:hypothetical protein
MTTDIQNEQDGYIMCNNLEFPFSSHNIVRPNHNSIALTIALLQLEEEWLT